MYVKRSFYFEYFVATIIAVGMYLLLRPLVGWVEYWFVLGPLILVFCFHVTIGNTSPRK